MNELVNSKLINLLAETSQVTNEEMQSAYGYFMEQVRVVSQSEGNRFEAFRILNITRIELVFLESLYRCEQGEKRFEICLFQKNHFIS